MGEHARLYGTGQGPGKGTRHVGAYTLGPLSQEAKGEYEVWAEDRALMKAKAFRERHKGPLGLEFYNNTQESINAEEYTWGERAWRRTIRTNAGSIKLVHTLMLPNHPGATIAEAEKLIEEHTEECTAACSYYLNDRPNMQGPEQEAPAK